MSKTNHLDSFRSLKPSYSGIVRLYSSSLLSKWGFDDGDLFWDFIHDLCLDDLGVDGGELLVEVVRQHLLPKLNHKVTLVNWADGGSMHNDARAEAIDGEYFSTAVWYGKEAGPELTPEFVEVPYSEVYRIAISILSGSEVTA